MPCLNSKMQNEHFQIDTENKFTWKLEQMAILFFHIAPFDILTNSPEKINGPCYSFVVVYVHLYVRRCNGAVTSKDLLFYDSNSQFNQLLCSTRIHFLSICLSVFRILAFVLHLVWRFINFFCMFCMPFYLFPVSKSMSIYFMVPLLKLSFFYWMIRMQKATLTTAFTYHHFMH